MNQPSAPSAVRTVRAVELVALSDTALRIHLTTAGKTEVRDFSHAELTSLNNVPNQGVYIYCPNRDGLLENPLGVVGLDTELTISGP